MKFSAAVVACLALPAAAGRVKIAKISAPLEQAKAWMTEAQAGSIFAMESAEKEMTEHPDLFQIPTKEGHGVKPEGMAMHSVRAATADAFKKVPKLRAEARESRMAFNNMLRTEAQPKEAVMQKSGPVPHLSRRQLETKMVFSDFERTYQQRKLNENYNQAYNQYAQQYGDGNQQQQQYNGNANGQQQYNGNANGNANQYQNNQAQQNQEGGEQQANQNGQQGNGQYQYNGNYANGQNGWYSYGDYEWNADMEMGQFGFDINRYAVKYTGCHRMETYNDNIAMNENINSALGKQSYATFRLCPADECVENNNWGCSNNYGEYVVSMETFLDAIFGYNEERVYGYCEYCSGCANIESYKSWAKQLQVQKEYTVQQAETLFETYYEALIQEEQNKNQYTYNANQNKNNNWWNWGYGNNNQNANEEAQQQEQQYDEYGNAVNNYQSNYFQNMDEDEAKAYAMLQYFKKVKNNQYAYGASGVYGYNNNKNQANQNNNNYQGGYYANGQYNPSNGYYGGNNNAYMQQNVASNYNPYNQDMWRAQTTSSNQGKEYQAWQSMGQFATWGPFMVYPGYFDDDGEFVAEFGYFNGYGQFISLEEENVAYYDEQVYGYMPEGWADIIEENADRDPEEIESCEMEYAGNCYTQYQTCMYLLYDEAQDEAQRYNQYMMQQMNAHNDDEYMDEDWWNQMQQNYEEYQDEMEAEQAAGQRAANQHDRQREIEQLMMCQRVNYNPYRWPGDANYNAYKNVQNNGDDENQQQQGGQQAASYSSQEINAEMYQYNMYINSQIEACNGDADCEEALEYQREQNQEYQEWVKANQDNQWREYQDMNLGYYVGAACDSNSGGLGLAVYRDEECQVLDEDLSVEKVLGYDPMDFIDDLVPQECIACHLDELQMYQQQKEWYEDEDRGEDEVYQEGVAPICSLLYQVSGKCNKNLTPQEMGELSTGYYSNGEYYQTSYSTMYQSATQQANEELVCSFIESLNSGTYKEDGQVYLAHTNFNWKHPGAFVTQSGEPQEIPGAMKAALAISALAATGMAILACMLHGALARKNIPWRPKRLDGQDPTDIARQNSGIVMGRSRSGPATAPLI